MIKRFTKRRLCITLLLIFLSFILWNYPEDIMEEDNDKDNVFIYSLNEDNLLHREFGMVNENDTIRNVISSLTMDSNDSDKLIPFNTKLINYSLSNGLLKLNFSEELLNITEDKEEMMIESLIFSLTEVDGVEKIMIFVNGVKLNELPNSKKRLGLYLDRSYGINKIYDLTEIKNTSLVTIYYYDRANCLVPVSYVSNEEDKISIIIKSLQSNTLNLSSLSSHLNSQIELMNYEINDDSIYLYFNDILSNFVFDGHLLEEVKYSLSYSITDSLNVKNVLFYIGDDMIDEFRLENQKVLLYN